MVHASNVVTRSAWAVIVLTFVVLSATPALASNSRVLRVSAASTGSAVVGWSNRTPPVSPPAVGGGMMAFSSAADAFVLFGGSTGVATNSTWVLYLNGSVWTPLHPVVSPPPRADGMFVYDSVADAFIQFGGWFEKPDETYLRWGDTWAFYLGNDTWVPLHPARSPSPRSDAAIAYDAADDATFLLGGFNGTAYLGDEWAFSLANDSWWPRTAPIMPSRRADGRMTFDSQTRFFYLYGGNDYSGPNFTYHHLGDTWEYSWTARQWTQLFPTSTPGALDYAVLAADPKSGVLLMNGGYGESVVLSDTWVFNTTRSDWARLQTAVSPPPRMAGVGGYDPVADRFVVFSGGDVAVARDDTWVLTYPATLQVAATASATEVSPGSSVSFTGTVMGGTGFLSAASWTFGDGDSGNGTSTTHTFASAGVYTVLFEVTDANGRTSQAAIQIAVGISGLPWLELAAGAGTGIAVLAVGVTVWLRRRRTSTEPRPPEQERDERPR